LNKRCVPKTINNLFKLEMDFDAVNLFKYKNTSSWVKIKNYLYILSLNNTISSHSMKKNIISKNGLILILLSIKNYLLNVFNRKKRDLYIGAGSGLFKYEDSVLDSYFPMNNEEVDMIYMLSADYAKTLIQYTSFISRKKVVIYSYLMGPLKILFTKIFKIFIKVKIENNFINFLDKNDLITSKKDLQSIHANFVITTILFKIFLYPLNIKKAYIVSAYSNSEICSVLKNRGIEIIELQHGLIGATHRGYNYAIKNALLPIPEKVNVYNDFWKEELVRAGYFSENDINVTGRLKYQLVNKNISSLDGNSIVFTGQGGFYKEIKDLFMGSMGYLSRNDMRLVYIPHPNEDRKSLSLLKRAVAELENITILEGGMFTTEQYIYNSIAHISIYSSCHFDAIHYKNKTYIFDIMNDNPMEYYSTHFKESFINIKTIEGVKI
jgi:hypothetical protein